MFYLFFHKIIKNLNNINILGAVGFKFANQYKILKIVIIRDFFTKIVFYKNNLNIIWIIYL